MKYLFSFLSVVLLFGATFAQVDDTLCRSSQGAQVEAGIVFVNNGSTEFVKCFKGSVLQPIGGNMIYEDVVTVDTTKTPTRISGLDAVGTSLEYGTVYRLPEYRQKTLTISNNFGTASVIEESFSIKNSIALGLVGLLLILGGVTLFSRSSKD